MIEKGITEIENALEKAVRRDCSNNVTVSFSGGIDSTLVAYLAKKHTDVELIAVGIEDYHDIEAAKSAAKLIDSDLSIITMNGDDIITEAAVLQKKLNLTQFEVGFMLPY